MKKSHVSAAVLISSIVMIALGVYLAKFASGIDSIISGFILAIAGFILLIMWIFGRK